MSFDASIFKTLAAGERPSAESFGAALNTILKGEAQSADVSALLLGYRHSWHGRHGITYALYLNGLRLGVRGCWRQSCQTRQSCGQ